MKKKVVVILNGISLRKKFFYRRLYPALRQVCEPEITETRSKNDAVALASKAADQKADLVFAAGGDGTLNQVVNGVLKGRETSNALPVIGLIPLGSGNDFARTVGMTANPEHMRNLISRFAPKKVDVGQVHFTAAGYSDDPSCYFVNVADIGMGPEVVKRVESSGRAFGHGLAYYKSILTTFVAYKPMNVKAVSDQWRWQGKLRTLAIANANYYGHGLCIAPDAVLDDRTLNVFICGNVSVLDFIRYTAPLKKGKHVRLGEVHYKETSSISLTSDAMCFIQGDGEILGTLPATVKLIDRQLDFLI